MSKEKARLRIAKPDAKIFQQRAEQEVDSAVWDLDPTKQYVRRYGWLEIIKDYVQRCRKDGYDEPWKYLTLPGPNALDIGFFLNEGLLQRTADGKLNVAICDYGKGDEVANKLGKWGGPLAVSSKLLHQELENPNSEFDRHFPFDVINMDLCDSLYPPRNDDNLKALDWIFLKQRGRSFILLLTSNPELLAYDELLRILNQNLNHNKQFEKAYTERYGGRKLRASAQGEISFVQILFPKVLARMARQKGYSPREHFAAHYGRRAKDGHEYEIITHSFEFEPLGREGRAKYEPRFDVVPRSGIRSHIHIDLPKDVESAARQAHEDFLVTLPSRSTQDVTDILRSDRTLYLKLDQEARALDKWYLKKVKE